VKKELEKLDAILKAGSNTLDSALRASKEPLIGGGVFEFHDVDYLEVEVLKLPVTGLSLDFLWRFSKPFAGILNIEPIRLSHNLTQISNEPYEERLKKEILAQWKKMVKENCDIYKDGHELKVQSLIYKWENITEVKIHYLKLVREEK